MNFLESIELPAWASVSIVAAVVFAFVWWKFRDELMFPFKHVKAEGVITNWMSMNERGVRYFYPIIEFTTNTGQVMKFRAEERCEGQPLYEPGTKVIVKYLPSDPKNTKTIFPA